MWNEKFAWHFHLLLSVEPELMTCGCLVLPALLGLALTCYCCSWTGRIVELLPLVWAAGPGQLRTEASYHAQWRWNTLQCTQTLRNYTKTMYNMFLMLHNDNRLHEVSECTLAMFFICLHIFTCCSYSRYIWRYLSYLTSCYNCSRYIWGYLSYLISCYNCCRYIWGYLSYLTSCYNWSRYIWGYLSLLNLLL